MIESFLEDINNVLTSGEVPNLYPADELAPIRDGVRADAVKSGVDDTPDNLFAFFIERARENLHVVVAMSPIGESFRNRVRMFPGLVNCTTIDWFLDWPVHSPDTTLICAHAHITSSLAATFKKQRDAESCHESCPTHAIAVNAAHPSHTRGAARCSALRRRGAPRPGRASPHCQCQCHRRSWQLQRALRC